MRRFAHRHARALLLAGALVLLVPAMALAHLGLLRSDPAEGAHLAEAPRQLKLTFTEAVEAAVARLRLIGPSGAEVPVSPLRQPADSAQIIIADVRGALEGGVYRLEWQVVGADGHPVRGTIAYVIAPGATGLDDPARVDAPAGSGAGETGGGAPATATGTATGTTSSTASGDNPPQHDPTALPSGDFFDAQSTGYVVVRAVQYAALLVIVGALAFAFVVLELFQRHEPDPDVADAMRSRAASLGAWASIALLLTAIARLYAQSLAMHGAGEALAPAFIAAMVVMTVWGWAWLIQLAAGVVAAVGFALARRGRASGWVLAGIAGLALAVTPALSGHAVATPGFALQAVIADTLHVIGAAGWLGSLLIVLVAGIPIAMRVGPEVRGATVARLVHAFSPTALLFAGIAVLTGVVATWLHIGFSAALWTSDYGRMLLIKLAILSVVLATGAYNWLRVRPALGDESGARRVQRSATIELGVGALVVIVTAILVATPPPVDIRDDDGAASIQGTAASDARR